LSVEAGEKVYFIDQLPEAEKTGWAKIQKITDPTKIGFVPLSFMKFSKQTPQHKTYYKVVAPHLKENPDEVFRIFQQLILFFLFFFLWCLLGFSDFLLFLLFFFSVES
jgi:hypothetical protein